MSNFSKAMSIKNKNMICLPWERTYFVEGEISNRKIMEGKD